MGCAAGKSPIMNTIAHSPHAHAPVSIGKVMGTVLIALVPATLYGFWLYGWPAFFLWTVTILAALLGEAFVLHLRAQAVRPALLDGSAVLTAWLLAMSLPPFAPWWLGAVGGLFAIVVVKQVFGGLGQNVFNPAMAARVMLLISFPVQMTMWAMPQVEHAVGFVEGLSITFGGAHWDAMASASLLGHVKTEFTRGIDLLHSLPGHFETSAALAGNRTGSFGETSALLLLAGGVFLIAKRIITWHGPAGMLLGVALPAAVAHAIAPEHYLAVLPHLLSGGVMLAAFFIVTDPVTSPSTATGMFVFGLLCGLLTWVIRTWGGYPEGVAFAVMIANALTPVIERYIKPRIYGRDRNGAALKPANREA